MEKIIYQIKKECTDKYLITKAIVQAFIKQKSKFSYEQVQNEIRKRDGIMRVSTCVTVSDYLDEFEKNGVLKYELDEKDGHFCVM